MKTKGDRSTLRIAICDDDSATVQANRSIAEDCLKQCGSAGEINGELRTTKTEGGLHGWGLKSAQTAAEKYDGCVQAGVSGEVFRAAATLSYQGMEDVHE